jgi:hypothetical protein
MNKDVLATFEEHGVTVETVLSDTGQESCGRPNQHPYRLFLQFKDIAHRTPRVRRPQSNGILEGFRRTLLDEHFWVEGRGMNGPAPGQTFTEGALKPH